MGLWNNRTNSQGGLAIVFSVRRPVKNRPRIINFRNYSVRVPLIKRDIFLILFTYPYLIFLFFINFVSNFHLLLLVISFCIAISKFILDLLNKNPRIRVFRWPVISILTVFGLVSSIMLISNGDNFTTF